MIELIGTEEMKIDEYSDLAMRTAPPVKELSTMDLLLASIALCEEAGELAGKIKKHIFHGHELDINEAIKELGDVQWYVAFFARVLGVPLSEVCHQNIAKLMKRYPDGFSCEASINRSE